MTLIQGIFCTITQPKRVVKPQEKEGGFFEPETALWINTQVTQTV